MSTNIAQLDPLRYPIGRFKRPETLNAESAQRPCERCTNYLRSCARRLRICPPINWTHPYREGGWTVRQLVHHLADSHLNAYTRMRLALTEDWPTIKPYKQALWAELHDARQAPIVLSLELLGSLHARWVTLMTSLGEPEWKRGYVHPESGRQSLEQVLATYDWHSRHHLAHLTGLRSRMHW